VAAIVARVDEVEDDEELDAVRSGMPEDAFLAALASSLSLGGPDPRPWSPWTERPGSPNSPNAGIPWREPVVEHATMTLAARCGITVASTRLMELDGHFVLLVERFDRLSGGSRHVISGFTVTGAEEDGDWGSYQNLAEQARRLGDADSGPEIFRRMAFNALCSNRDDHLRNHAFFVSRKTIAMTPAYDLVPSSIRFRQWDLSLRCGREGRAATRSNILSDVRPFGSAKVRRRNLGRDAGNGRRLARAFRRARRDKAGNGGAQAPLRIGRGFIKGVITRILASFRWVLKLKCVGH
jgi:Uncharacterized protein related to capsule biosynthesis enzymes